MNIRLPQTAFLTTDDGIKPCDLRNCTALPEIQIQLDPEEILAIIKPTDLGVKLKEEK